MQTIVNLISNFPVELKGYTASGSWRNHVVFDGSVYEKDIRNAKYIGTFYESFNKNLSHKKS